METVLDLHLHSRFSRACSADLTLSNIEQACQRKGIDIVGTADFTHPQWLAEIKEQLVEDGSSGLYQLVERTSPVRFLLNTEVSLVYRQGGQCRRVHLVVHAPNLETVDQINGWLKQQGFNLASDGRPILGLAVPDLVKVCQKINPQIIIYPAHIWTPWYSVFGSKSGFDSLEECFGDQLEFIYAYETGLSSDPPMNWRVSELDNFVLLSNSDAHSVNNLAREATIIKLKNKTYLEFYDLLKNRAKDKIIATIEYYPEEGMYHLDGHRDCQVVCQPEQTKELADRCPKCQRLLTVGVLNRVEELANRPVGYRPADAPNFERLVALDKIIAGSLGIKGRQTKKVQTVYDQMIDQLGNELFILRQADLVKIKEGFGERVAQGVERVRQGQLTIEPGYDGQYGQVTIF